MNDYHNQFLVFGGDDNYHLDGWDNFICDQPTLDDAIRMASGENGLGHDWFQIVNLHNNKIVWKSHQGCVTFFKI